MARYSTGVKTAAGSTTLPSISIYAAAAVGFTVREIGIFNTTANAADYRVVRLSTQGTPGAGTVVNKYNPDSVAASATPFTTHSVTGTATDAGYRASLGAAIGSGVIWTFGDTGLRVLPGTGNGLGVEVENGTGQALQAYIVWDE